MKLELPSEISLLRLFWGVIFLQWYQNWKFFTSKQSESLDVPHIWLCGAFFFSSLQRKQFTKKKKNIPLFVSGYNQVSIGWNAALNLPGILEWCPAPLLGSVLSSCARFFLVLLTCVSSIRLWKEIKTPLKLTWGEKCVYKALCTLAHQSSEGGANIKFSYCFTSEKTGLLTFLDF